ncbi:MAG: hypothetical protein KJ579_01395 [Verrucomicrobia bacterium]|nr:hypothetical protein [Verrucomicrobiota bacterium]
MKNEIRGPRSEVGNGAASRKGAKAQRVGLAASRLGVSLLLCGLFAAGCSSMFQSRERIGDTHGYSKGQCEAWLAEAEKRLGLKYAGDGIAVYVHQGTKRSASGAWCDANGRGAWTEGGSERQYVHLVVDPATGQETGEEGVHEMAHPVLWSHGVSGHPAKYAHLFLNWR